MENDNRAKQFMPFDALKGLREALKEKEMVVIEKREITPDEADKLNNRIQEIKKGDIITIIFYNNKDIVEMTGMLSKIDLVNKELVVVKERISFNNIFEIKDN